MQTKALNPYSPYGLYLTATAWIFFFIAFIIEAGQISIFHLTMALFMTFASAYHKTWLRVLVLIYNLLMAGFIFHGLIYSGNIVISLTTALKAGSILLFTVSALFLLQKNN